MLCLVVGLGVTTPAQEANPDPTWPVPNYEREAPAPEAELPFLEGDPTLSDYLGYAALNNPGLEAAFNRWKAAVEKAERADTLPDPKFTYTTFIQEVETRVGPQKAKYGVMQMFPWFGTLKLRKDVAAQAANAAFAQYQAAKFDLFYRVTMAYFEYFYLHRSIEITEDNIQLLTHLESVARSRMISGGSQSGVIKAQVELGKLDDRARTLRDMREPMVARLNAALNRPPDEPLAWPAEAPEAGALLDEDALVESLAHGNPDLRALDASIRQEDRALALAHKAFYPSFSLGVDYVDTDEALMPGTPDSGKDPIMAMITLDIPLWRASYKAGVEEARRRRLAAELTREDKGHSLEADLKMALFTYRDAERKIDLYGDTLVPQAEQALNVTEEAYRSGSMDYLNLIDAERLLLEFRLAHERALADREIAVAHIEKLVGHPLPRASANQKAEQ